MPARKKWELDMFDGSNSILCEVDEHVRRAQGELRIVPSGKVVREGRRRMCLSWVYLYPGIAYPTYPTLNAFCETTESGCSGFTLGG